MKLTTAATITMLPAVASTPWPSGSPSPAAIAVEVPMGARLSPDGASVAFIVGDSIFVSGVAARPARAVAGGVGFEAQAARKQLVWSQDSRFLLFRHGTPPRMTFAVVEAASGQPSDVLPDSLAGRLRTVGNIFTGPPIWSPTSDRIAFVAGRVDEMRSVDVVYVAARGEDGVWDVKPVTSDHVEKTAVGWSKGHLAWASRERDGSATVTIATVSGDSVGPRSLVRSGNARITGLIPSPDGTRFLVTRAASAPQVIDVGTTQLAAHVALPPATRIDSYVGWASDSAVLAFRYPSEWRSELVIIDVLTGRSHGIMATDATLEDGTLAISNRGVRVVFSEEDGSHPRSYRTLLITQDENVADSGSVTPARFEAPAEPWSTRIVTWRTRDGLSLHAQLLRPTAVEGPRRTVVVPYGGYRNTALSDTYFLDVLLRALLRDGWQVIRPNTRAADVLRQKSGYGSVQLSDTDDLVDALAAEGLLDRNRVALVGHSHGASLAYYYATHATTFCAIVAVNGRADWVMQARYDGDGLLPRPMGASPDEDPALYAAASPLPNAQAVTSPMLLVAGAQDGQILPANATVMADSLRAHSRAFDLLVFDDEGHLIEHEANRRDLIHRARRTLAACGPRPDRQ